MKQRNLFSLTAICAVSFALVACDLQPRISNVFHGDKSADVSEYDQSRVENLGVASYGTNHDLYGKAEIEYANKSDYSKSKITSVNRQTVVAKAKPVEKPLPEPVKQDPVEIVKVEKIEDVKTVYQEPAPPVIEEKEEDDVLLVPPKVANYKKAPTLVKSSVSEIIVAKGDTIYGISKRAGVPLRDLADANNLSAPYTLSVGQKLTLPASRIHTVIVGDTLYSISRKYSVDLHSLVSLNDLKEPFALSVGQKLKLPATVRTTEIITPVVIAPIAPLVTSTVTKVQKPVQKKPVEEKVIEQKTIVKTAKTEVKKGSGSTGMIKALPAVTARAGTKFAWPVRGKIVSDFGAKKNGLYNDGINIASSTGTTVGAAENGVVAYAGNELKGMGNLVIVRHSGGYMSVYAHMDSISVSRGKKVSIGQKIGTVGATGKVSSPQLHFEIRKGTKAYDPRKMLK